MNTPRTVASRRVAAVLASLLLAAGSMAAARACEGTTEYPKTAAKLSAATLPAEQKTALTQKFEEGRHMHDAAHERNDRTAMAASLKTLAEVKAALPTE